MSIDISAEIRFTPAGKGGYYVRLLNDEQTVIGRLSRTTDEQAWMGYTPDGSFTGTFRTRYEAAQPLLKAYELANGLRDSEGRRVTKDLETGLWFVANHYGGRESSRWVDKFHAIAKLASLQPTDFEAVGRQAALDDKPAAPSLNPDVRYALAGTQVGDPENVRIMEAFSKGYQAVRDEQAQAILTEQTDQANAWSELPYQEHTAEVVKHTPEPEILTAADASALVAIINAAVTNQRVARLIEGRVNVGTARSIVADTNCNRLDSKTDIRDGYLHVTLRVGWEVFWPVRDLMPQYPTGEFIVGYED